MNSHTTEPHAKGEFGEPPARNAGPGIGHIVRKVLKPIASLQLTVVLFVLGIGLIFFGTMAQLDYGIWTVVDKYFWSWVVWVPFDLFNKFLGVFWKDFFPPGSVWGGSFPFPAGKLLGGLMLLNLLAAHTLRFRISWKRAGIFLIHSGLILLFVGEFITREYAIEQRMTIDEGKSVNYTESSRHVEFAIVDRSNPKTDTVVVIPENVLKQKGRITNADLPFDVEVVDYMANSGRTTPKSGTPNPADSGLGKMWIAVKKDEVSGVDPNQQVDFPSAYVKLFKKGTDERLGTYLASLELGLVGGEDEIDIGDKKYFMSLRFQRYYKPYRIHLDKFRFDRFTGTEKPKNYSSDVRVQDAAGNDIFPYHIAMNEPLRYDGETFYQSSFDKRTEQTTVLQVVKNPGWLLPYISCVMVGLGLIAHFLIYLIQFLRRNAAAPVMTAVAAATLPEISRPSKFVRYLPWVITAIMALYLLSIGMRMTPKKVPFDYDAAGRMRVSEGGRVKPLDTAARVYLRMISGREELEDDKGEKLTAIRWYLDTIATGSPESRDKGQAWDHRIFRVDNEQVLQTLKLEKREGYRYSMRELAPNLPTLQKRLDEIARKVQAKKKLDTDETKFKELRDRIETYLDVTEMGGKPEDTIPGKAPHYGGLQLLPPLEGKDWTSLRKNRDEAQERNLLMGIVAVQPILEARLKKLSDKDVNEVLKRLGVNPEEMPAEKLSQARKQILEVLQADPASMPSPRARQMWFDTALAVLDEAEEKQVRELMAANAKNHSVSHPAVGIWDRLVAAYRENRPNDFAREMEAYNSLVNERVPDRTEGTNGFEKALYSVFNSVGHNKVEITFNRFAPFYQCAGLYVIAFVLSLLGFIQQAAGRPDWGVALRRSAFYLLVLTFVLHAVAMFARMYLMERPLVFVTNLYSSAIFIGLGCVGLCLIIERIFPIGVGNALAAMLGLVTTIVAHNIASEDTLEMMQAVLDTNFWLATHVTTVTLGYTATFVAGFLGALYVLQMLGAVIRDSYVKAGEPTAGELLAFSVAALGVVGIPICFLAFMTSALDKFEKAPSVLLWGVFGLIAAAGVMYAMALMLLRAGMTGVDSHGKPAVGELPNIAKPVAALGLTPERGKIFGQMVYGVVCFATLLSFIGTVLGGIWADQSWGRFWGWDPKENGAVLIVLWNSLILHARWAGLVKDRGVAVLAIAGNMITAWSWFGTNQLSIGLHAYGFDSRLADGCFNFWISQLFIIGLGLIPQQFWASVTRRVAATSASAASSTSAAQPQSHSPSTNGVQQPHTNGHVNGKPKENGQSRRDKKKRQDKK